MVLHCSVSAPNLFYWAIKQLVAVKRAPALSATNSHSNAFVVCHLFVVAPKKIPTYKNEYKVLSWIASEGDYSASVNNVTVLHFDGYHCT